MLITMGAIKDLFESERGLLAVVLAVAATVMFGLGRMTTDQWTTFATWIYTTYAAAKTATGVLAILRPAPAAGASPTVSGPSADPAPAPTLVVPKAA